MVGGSRRGKLAGLRCQTFNLRSQAGRWGERVQHKGMVKRALRILAQAFYEHPKSAQPEHLDLLRLRNSPGLEVGAVRQIEVFQKPSLEALCQRLQAGHVQLLHLLRLQSGDLAEIAIEPGSIQGDEIAVGAYPAFAVRVD